MKASITFLKLYNFVYNFGVNHIQYPIKNYVSLMLLGFLLSYFDLYGIKAGVDGENFPEKVIVDENSNFNLEKAKKYPILLGNANVEPLGTKNHLGDGYIENVYERSMWKKLPSKGILSEIEIEDVLHEGVLRKKRTIYYTPYPHAEGQDTFIWRVSDSRDYEHNYTCIIDIQRRDDPPQIFIDNVGPLGSSNSLNFDEEQSFVAKLLIVDPDPGLISGEVENIKIRITGDDNGSFQFSPEELTPTKLTPSANRNGWSWEVDLIYQGIPNYETISQKDWNIVVELEEDLESGGKTTISSFNIKLNDIGEGPQFQHGQYPVVLPMGDQTLRSLQPTDITFEARGRHEYDLLLKEGGNTDILIPFSIYAPDRKVNADGKSVNKSIKIYYESNRTKVYKEGEVPLILDSTIPAEIEIVEVGFTQAAEIVVTKVSDSGQIEDFDLTNSGFGYDLSTSDLISANTNDDSRNISFTLSDVLDTDLKGTITKEKLSIIEQSGVYDENETFTLGDPTNKDFKIIKDKFVHDKLPSSETDSLEVPSFASGEIKITFPLPDSFQSKIKYKFYASDEDGKVALDASDKKIPFLTLNVTVENDYADPIQLEMVIPEQEAGIDGVGQPHTIKIEENTFGFLADLDATDADTAIDEIERKDKNTGNEGALVRYDIQWDEHNTHPWKQRFEDPAEFFEITADGKLYLKSKEDLSENIKDNYRELFNTYFDYDEIRKYQGIPSGALEHTFWYIKVIAFDSSEATGHEAFQRFKIQVTDVAEDPLFVNSSGAAITDLPVFNIHTQENTSWEYFPIIHGPLRAKDFDYNHMGSASNYKTPQWILKNKPKSGSISEDIIQETDEDGIREVVKFFYTPDENFWGSDEFSLFYSNENQEIRFNVEVNNTADKPVLSLFEIYDPSNKIPKETITPEGNLFTGLKLMELVNRRFEITFKDEQDFDEIILDPEKQISGDIEYFNFTVTYDPNRKWEKKLAFELKQLLDFEKFQGPTGEANFELFIDVLDASLDTENNSDRFTFNFFLEDDDEPALLFANGKDHKIPVLAAENQDIAIKSLLPRDPEGVEKIYYWEIFGGPHQNYFQPIVPQRSITGEEVSLKFKEERIPNYESGEDLELNVTLRITDRNISDVASKDDNDDFYYLTIKIYGMNDDPVQIQSEYAIQEPDQEIGKELKEFFYDEDNDTLFFQLLSSTGGLPGEKRGPDSEYFDEDLVKDEKRLYFINPTDHESRDIPRYDITVRVFDDKQDGQNYIDANISIVVDDLNEAPQVRLGSRSDAEVNEPPTYNIENEVISYYVFDGDEAWNEDEKKWINQFYFFNPEDSVPNTQNLIYKIVGEPRGDFSFFPSDTNPNGTFEFKPPADYYNTVNGERVDEYLSVELNITDKDTHQKSSLFTLYFQVNNVDDPPRITPVVNEEESLLNQENEIWFINNYEGNIKVLYLDSNDTVDPKPSRSFKWSLSGNDANLFRLTQQRANDAAVYLEWNPSNDIENLNLGDTPNFSNQPINPNFPDLPQGREYDLSITLRDENTPIEESDPSTYSRVNLRIQIENVLNRPPEFIPADNELTLPEFVEESASNFIYSLRAEDPDAEERENQGQGLRQPVFELNNTFGDNELINLTGSKLTFFNIPDYESHFYDLGKTPSVRFKVHAYFDEDKTKKSSQTIIVPIANLVEEPFFEPIGNFSTDTNFSMFEDATDSFTINSSTTDFNKTLILTLPANTKDNDLFTVNSFLLADGVTTRSIIQFKTPPNRESPRDRNKDNIYEIDIKASAGAESGAEVFKIETLLIEVKDAVSDFVLGGTDYFEVAENSIFVADLEVDDIENENIFSDILFTTDEGTYYVPDSSDASATSLFDKDSFVEIDVSIETRGAVYADFNNDGSQDVVTISENSAQILINDGFGTFENKAIVLLENSGSPRDVVAADFDQDGDQDILLSHYNIATSGLFLFKNPSPDEPPETPFDKITIDINSIEKPRKLELIDLDGDFDLDVLVIDQSAHKLFWLENNNTGNSSPFLAPKQLFPTVLFDDLREVFPINLESTGNNHSQSIYSKKDLLIVDGNQIHLARKLESGEYDISPVVEIPQSKYIISLETINLNKDNNLTDLVFLDSDGKSLWFSFQQRVQGSVSFSAPNEEPMSMEDSRHKASSIKVFYDEHMQSVGPRILVGTNTPPMIYEFSYPNSTDTDLGIEFSTPVKISLNGLDSGRIFSMHQADLDRAYNHYSFEIINNSYNFELFDDSKFRDSGKLYFQNAPDFEDPEIDGLDNLFKVQVKYKKVNIQDGSPVEKSKLISVQVLDVGEPSLITQTLDHLHKENLLLVWENLEVQNPESSYEDLNFSIVPGLDGDFFEIDPGTGRLSFIDSKRFEDKDDANHDSIYEVTVRVDEINVLNPFSDQRTFSINLDDGYEPPVLEDQNIYLSIVEDDEDGIFYDLNDFNVTDHPGNITQGLRGASIYKQGGQGIADIKYFISNGNLDGNFTYKGDANESGDDLVILEFTNESNLSSFLYVNISISPLNDPPVARVPNLIFHPEGKKLVTPLNAYDSDSSDSQISWGLDNDSSKFFEIKNNGTELQLHFINKPDFESDQSRNYTGSLILSDGFNETFHAINIQITDQIDQVPESSILNNAKANVFTVVERTYDVTDLGVFDKDLGDIVHARVSGGLDKEFFEVINGKLKIKPQYLLNFDSPEDVDSDNTYEVEVTLSDTGNLSTDYKIYVRIVNLDDNPPVFLNFDTEASRILKIAENQHFVTKLYANDVEVEDLTFGISQVKDYEMFEINSSDQTLYLVNPLNYENIIQKEADFLLNEKFEVVINLTDGTYTTELTLYIEVTDVNDPPRLNALTYSLNEDSSISGNLSWSDEDGDSVQLEILNSPMYGIFQFDSISGTFSYFPKKDFNGDDGFRVLIKDDTNASSINDVKLVVLPVNDKPVAVEDFYYFFSGEYNQSTPFVFSVLDNDNSGPDDSTEMANYIVSRSGANEDVDLYATSQNGEFTFEITDSTSLGAYEFPYLIQDGDLNDTAQAVVWVATLPSLPQWISLRNFGLFYHQPLAANSAWIYHQKMGWVYVSEFSDIYNATWIWHELIGWFWTGDWNAELSRSRWMYANSLKQWIHWEGGIRDSRGWFTRDYVDNIYDEDFFVRLNIRNEIIEILPDISELVNYLGNSNYFTRADIVRIIGELNRFRESSTLDSILEYKLPY